MLHHYRLHSNAPNVPVDADTSKLIAKSVNFCLIKLLDELMPSFTIPKVVVPVKYYLNQ